MNSNHWYTICEEYLETFHRNLLSEFRKLHKHCKDSKADNVGYIKPIEWIRNKLEKPDDWGLNNMKNELSAPVTRPYIS